MLCYVILYYIILIYISPYFQTVFHLLFNLLLSFRYVTDETSPRNYDPLHPDDYDYEILSKSLVKKT